MAFVVLHNTHEVAQHDVLDGFDTVCCEKEMLGCSIIIIAHRRDIDPLINMSASPRAVVVGSLLPMCLVSYV